MKHHTRLEFALIFTLAHGSLAMGVEIHVAPNGADTQPGTVQAPVKTPEAARNLARKYAGKEPVTILFADGVYYLDQTLLLTDADSGGKSAPVVYKAAHEGKAVLSGGLPLKLQWSPHKDGIYKAATPAGLELDQLFVDGTRQHMARYPNYDPAKTTVPYRGSAAGAFAPERAAKWADPTGGYIHAMHGASWGVMPNPVIKPDLTPFTPPAAQPAAVVWQGATLGEPKGETLSAYGVAFDNGGVSIEKIKPKSPLRGDKGLQEGDLIQGINGNKITSIADLKKVLGGIKDGKLTLNVIRSQKAETVELKVGFKGLFSNKPLETDNQ